MQTLEGNAHGTVTLPGGQLTRVRLLTYLDGIQIRETTRTAAQRRAMGTGLAALDRALHSFAHRGANHDLLWNVAAAHRLASKLDCIVDARRRALAEAFMKRFEDCVLPRLASLRSQVIHNDYHLYNVLVAPDDHARIVFSEVTISRHRRQDLHKFEEAIAGHREIVDWYNVSGGYDYLLKIVAPSVSCFHELMERLLEEDIGITKFTSRIVLRHAAGTRQYPIGLIASGKARATS